MILSEPKVHIAPASADGAYHAGSPFTTLISFLGVRVFGRPIHAGGGGGGLIFAVWHIICGGTLQLSLNVLHGF